MSDPSLTSASGIPVADNQNSITAGARGPILLQDFHLIEKLQHFNRERIPERVVHAKGSGAYGTFTVAHDITKYTQAKLFDKIGKITETFVRFFTVGGEKGSADTERDPRGFAVRFFTEQGNWDQVGNNTPMFFIKDPIKFPDFVHTHKRDPRSNLKAPTMMFDFWSRAPESLHQVTVLFSDRGTPDGYRHMDGFGSHTSSLIDAAGERVWVKWHLKTQQGIKNLSARDAVRLAGTDPDYAQSALFNAIERGEFPRWNVVLQGRRFAYHDAQLYRMGTNHQQLSVNRPRCPLHHQQRDGAMAIDDSGAAVNCANVESSGSRPSGLGHGDKGWAVEGATGRFDARASEDDYTQAGDLFRLLPTPEKQNLFHNMAGPLSQVSDQIQARMFGHLDRADPAYGAGARTAVAARSAK